MIPSVGQRWNTEESSGTDVGTYPMGLAEDQFTNKNDNFDVTFSVTDGELKINKTTLAITITGNKAEYDYDGTEKAGLLESYTTHE